MLLKGCLHTHTTCSDGSMTAQEVADVYAHLGYDFVAFTDHDHLWRPGQEEVYERVRTDLLILVGMELTVFEKGYLHVSRILGDREQLHVLNHVGAYDLALSQVLERIDAVASRFPLDAVEITHQGFRSEDLDVDAIRYPRIASDDAHVRSDCGRAWIEVDCERKRDSILRAVKLGQFWNCYAKG